MRRWLRSIRKREAISAQDLTVGTGVPHIELLVVEGGDTGQSFTVDGDEVHLGRRLPVAERRRGILLSDPTVSSRQAMIRRKPDGYHIDHNDAATNATLLDGTLARDALLCVGSRIEIGRVVLEIKAHEGLTISDLTQIHSVDTHARERDAGSPADDVTQQVVALSPILTSADETVINAAPPSLGRLIVEQGFEMLSGKSFAIEARAMLIGRGDQTDIQIMDAEISRKHAELVWDGVTTYLIHHSATNSTLLNGRRVIDRVALNDGDVITLADRITLRVRFDRQNAPAFASTSVSRTLSGQHAGSKGTGGVGAVESLQQVMEEKVRIEQHIEEQFSVEGSFLDVDVVKSFEMKTESASPEHIIVSFERFRGFVGGIVAEFWGQVLNSNGDELMCFFESPLNAVKAGSAILERLEAFNRDQNLLQAPFRFRIGVHTGKSLVDLDRGVAYSAILDVAGHLQKHAKTNSMVISQSTLDALPPGLPFERAGELEREAATYYRMTAPIE